MFFHLEVSKKLYNFVLNLTNIMIPIIEKEKVSKRNAILATTLKLISTHGFHAAPMSVIAKEANVAAGTIYIYFQNKEDLIIQLYYHVKEFLAKSIVISDEKMPYKQKVFSLWSNLYQFFCEHLEVYKFLEQYEDSPFITDAMTQDVELLFTHLQDFLQEGIDNGFLRFIDKRIIMMLLMQSVSTLMKLKLLPYPEFQEDETPQLIFQSFWDGVKVN